MIFKDIDQIRSECRLLLESLEMWLKNIIEREFNNTYGMCYWNYSDNSGTLIKKEIVESAKEKINNSPDRYKNFKEALYFDDLIAIICKRENYNKHFKKYIELAYPKGNDEVRYFLCQLKDIRNKLSHSTPIDLLEAYRVLCHSNEIINSIRKYYMSENMDKDFNVPQIIKITDSLGNEFSEKDIARNKYEQGICKPEKNKLREGNRFLIKAEIDPSFEREEYYVRWYYPDILHADTNQLEILLDSNHVNFDFPISCRVILKDRKSHKYRNYDDIVTIKYKVLPNE